MVKVVLLLFLTLHFKGHNCIRGGQHVGSGTYPFSVAVYSGNSLICGGALISHGWVVTAAECLEHPGLGVKVGGSDLTTHEPRSKFVAAKCSIQHPGYLTGSADYNIGLIRLESKLQFDEYIDAVEMANESARTNDKVTLTGYGDDRVIFSKPSVLREASLNVINVDSCSLQQSFAHIVPTQICTSHRGGSACSGDLGAPLISGSGKTASLVGIVGALPSFCSGLLPTVYMDISRFRNWIKTNKRCPLLGKQFQDTSEEID